MRRKNEYEEIVRDLCSNMETMDSDEYEEKFDSLPSKYQAEVREAERDFCDSAIGDTSWRNGTDWEDD